MTLSNRFDDRIPGIREPIKKLFDEISLSYFIENIPPGSKVLDCGCGNGFLSIPLAKSGCMVDAFDISELRIERLNECKNNLNINAMVADFWNLPYVEKKYDYVISRQFIQNFPDWRKFLIQKLKYTCKEGRIIWVQNSEENYSAAITNAFDSVKAAKKIKNYIYRLNKGPTIDSLKKFCRKNSCTIEKITPMLHFLPRGPMFSTNYSSKQIRVFREELSSWMEHEKVNSFIRWFEKNIVSDLPVVFASKVFIVIRCS